VLLNCENDENQAELKRVRLGLNYQVDEGKPKNGEKNSTKGKPQMLVNKNEEQFAFSRSKFTSMIKELIFLIDITL